MRVLIVEDEDAARKGLELLVSDLGLEAKGVATLAEAFEALGSWKPVVCLADMVLPDGDGLDLIRAARSMSAPPEVVALTGHGSVKVAVEAMKAGAYDYLLKPLKPVQLEAVLQHLTEKAERRRGPADPTGLAGADGFEGMVGRSETMREIFRLIGRVARSDAPVIITGESGTGKEATAAAIHSLSRRRDRALVAINCGAVSETLVESELFGHEKGAFTGADRRRMGYFEMAHGGTLFLDEVTEMSTELQVKFLRVLESRTFRRVGGGEELNADVRIIASSNRDLPEAVAAGKLREDLYYRLVVFPVRLPPLRERLEDVPLLARRFLDLIEQAEQAGIRDLDGEALDALSAHHWPGNVRELRNAMHRAYILSDGPVITADLVRTVLDGVPASTPIVLTTPPSSRCASASLSTRSSEKSWSRPSPSSAGTSSAPPRSSRSA
ncbi:MAG: sigma-54-dependent Fis family transcriptional regulator [Holophagales bacterium]|nr:sigma-54-dependent Fis family transcriptional regulator [Holophagales bacterium]